MYLPKKSDPFYVILRFMQFLHYYPSALDLKNIKFYKLVSAFMRIVSTFVWIECALHFYMSLKDNIPSDTTEDVVGITGVFNSMFVSMCFELNNTGWSHLFYDIIDTSRFGAPPKMAKLVKIAKYVNIIVSAYVTLGCSIYIFASCWLDAVTCKRMNQEKGIHEICGVVTPLWWPHDEIDPFRKLVVIIWQSYSIGVLLPPIGLLVGLSWECAEIIVTKIDHLKDLFEHVFDVEDPALQNRRLRHCIQYHQEILRITVDFNKLNKSMYGPMSLVAALIMAAISNQMLKTYSLGAVVHLAGYVLGLSMICLTGQRIKDETFNLQYGVYASKWYNGNPRVVRDLRLVVLRCQKPLLLESYPLGNFEFSTLIIILKTTYSYLTLINNNKN